jgi:hypothetical protein
MLRWIVNFVVTSTYVTLDREFCGNIHLKWTLPQNSRPNVTYVIAVTVNCSYCTPDDGRGECPKHVE